VESRQAVREPCLFSVPIVTKEDGLSRSICARFAARWVMSVALALTLAVLIASYEHRTDAAHSFGVQRAASRFPNDVVTAYV